LTTSQVLQDWAKIEVQEVDVFAQARAMSAAEAVESLNHVAEVRAPAPAPLRRPTVSTAQAARLNTEAREANEAGLYDEAQRLWLEAEKADASASQADWEPAERLAKQAEDALTAAEAVARAKDIAEMPDFDD
jgi:hypothetical protein